MLRFETVEKILISRCPFVGAFASLGPLPHGVGRLTITGACLQPGDPKCKQNYFKQYETSSISITSKLTSMFVF